MTSAPRNAIVLNTTVLSNFAHVQRVELLETLPRLVTVPAVRTELEDGVETHSYLTNALTALDTDIPVAELSPQAQTLEATFLERLDPGEAQAVAVAEAVDGTVITDDGDARTTAIQRDIRLTGSIGLLVRFVESDLISAAAADTYLKRWIDEAGFHSPARDFETFLTD
ncbi:twitching motility protein PilT [Haloarcula sp. NS06]|jgi:predicted nucleic acid-binding protein|uniref:twitching motility protein PilT n=1 Tax=Haloarcula sp. NS06 TaxID=3409688 RepID=UPI003DA78594